MISSTARIVATAGTPGTARMLTPVTPAAEGMPSKATKYQ
jgi:hypothetical protein